jgi:signal transduction histidine kinase
VIVRGLLVALGAALTAVAVTWGVYGEDAAWTTAQVLLPVGLLAVLVTDQLVRRRERLGSLRRQLVVIAVVVVVQFLVAVGLFVWLMSVSNHDAFFTVLVVLYAGLTGAWAGRGLAGSMLRDVDTVRDGLVAVGDGARDVVFPTTGRDELTELATAAMAMEHKLDGEERARRELVAAISHDLRTPITSLQLLADAVGDDVVDAATREEYLGRLRVHVRQLGALIDDLFELSRLEAGELRWRMERVELDALVAETVDSLRPDAQASGVRLTAQAGGPAGVAQANPEQLQRVLFNLLRNAIRHTPPDGSVTVRTSVDPEHVEIEVADTGEGIPAADRDRVFQPFVQGTDPSRRHGGSGLGLAISRAIVEAHGGRIWLADADRGTRVRVQLPAAT